MVQDVRQQTCPGCGAENPQTATFCWRCYQPLNQAGVQAPPSFMPPPVSRMPWPTEPVAPPQPERRSPWVTAAALVTATLVVAVVLVWWMGRGRVSMPESLGGLARVSTQETDQVAKQFRQTAGSQDLKGDIAFYGSGTTPSLFLFWVRDPGGTDLQSVFGAFGSGFVSGLGGTELTGQSTKTVEGVVYMCAPFGGRGLSGALCMWKNGDLYWILVDVQSGTNPDATRELAVQTEHAVA